ncbi:MAG TPA: NUDIX domain-containing protein [Fimbriimonadaceae bacterium]|nr:NUDIX domain-containing protein [Fimbriimonadaceae bacterium]HRJ33427.1 NUDIX domain-containing protein [Fimbriimonadaceae bacterium]
MRKFPIGSYGRQRLEFFPAPFRAPLRAFAALVFPWKGEQVLICDIEDRGWCIPSGRVEPFEESMAAAAREAREEAGALLRQIQYIGCYRITDRSEVRWADCYVAEVDELVEITAVGESRGRKLVSVDELPDIYHLWTDLTSEVFSFSREIILRHSKTLDALGESA